MTVLPTSRLLLLPLTREVLATRLRQDAFELRLTTPDGPLSVAFAPEWPGEPLGAFPFFLTVLNVNGVLDGSYIAVTRDLGRAVGMLGSKGPVNAVGEVEIGYGMNPSDSGHGYATEAVQALTAHLLDWPGVRTVAAQTAVGNVASQRVLAKCGFVQTGTAWDEEDGDLLTWATPANEYSSE